MTTKNNIQWLDTLRALATVGVIIIHVASPEVKMAFQSDMQAWWIGNFVDSAVRFAVPVFLMLTGATLLTRDQPVLTFYKRRITKVFFPFLFWMIVYWIFRWYELSPKQQPTAFMPVLQWAFHLFVDEGISKHFWHFYMILVVYLFLPFVGRFLRKQSSKNIGIFIVSWMIVNFFLRNYPMNMYSWLPDKMLVKIIGWFLHAGYLIVGYYLYNLKPISSLQRKLAIGVFVLSVFSSALFTGYFSLSSQSLDLSMYGYLKLNTVIQSIAFVLMFKDVSFENRVLCWLQKEICTYSYGIYLAHVMVLGLLFDHGVYWKITHPLISLPAVSLLTLVCCYFLVWILRKIPYIKYLAG